MAVSRPILEPPNWFWRLIDDADGDAARLRDDLATFDRDGLMLFYGYLRDLAMRLADPDWSPGATVPLPDRAAFERGGRQVTQGRERYRQALGRSTAVPPEAHADGDPERSRMLRMPADVWYEQFGDTMPTDIEIAWQPDGSAAAQ